jgi:hypothetical protein
MTTTYLDLYSELTASVRVLDVTMAQKAVCRAWTDIGKAYEWSWLRAQTALSAPDEISSGTVSIDQFSRDLTFDATATAILDALGLNIPLTVRSIKIDGGSPYQIASYTPGGTATLDPNGPVYQEETAVAASFQIYRAYFEPPSDFGRWISIRDPVSDYSLAFGAELTQELLDRFDPQRDDTTQPWGLFSAYARREIDANGATTSFTPRWEMWPRPTVARGYQATYRRRCVDFVNDDDQIPSTLDEEVVIWGAKVRAYEWAATQAGNQPLLQKTNWLQLMATAQIKYKEALRDAIRADRNVFPNVIVQGRRRFGLASPSWLQSHDLPWEGYGFGRGGFW